MYVATVFHGSSIYRKQFSTMAETQQWLNSENKNMEYTTMIETYDETGRKTDGFFFTMKE